jgi:plasmid stabilization system protein ParE
MDHMRKIMQWWAVHRDARQATRWYDGLIETLSALPDMPEQHPLARENDHFEFDLREVHFGLGSRATHRALHRVLPDTIEVLAVYHVAQDEIRPDRLM